MIDPIDFFNQANYLINTKSNVKEVDCRSALSRGYYSLYHVTHESLKGKHRKEVLDKVKEDLKSKNMSKYVRSRVNNLELSYLAQLGVNYHKILYNVLNGIDSSLAQYLKGARDDRNYADYELRMSFEEEETKLKINEIKQTISNVSSL